MRGSFIVLVLVASSVHADEIADSRRLQQQAVQAYKAKDYEQFLAKMQAASDLRPSHPTLLYNVAAALALNGRGVDAVAVLERVARMGMAYAPEKDGDFETIRSTPRFQSVVEAFRGNAVPQGRAQPAFKLSERGMIAEGLAYDRKSRRFLVSSVRTGSIVAVDRAGESSTLVRDLPRGVFGIAVDDRRAILWATTSSIAQNSNFRDEERDRAEVLKIDLRSGRVLNTFSATDPVKHLFGDLTVSPDGDVYVSNSSAPTVYRIHGDKIEPFLTGPFVSLQGLAVSRNGKRLYAADYSKGIAAIDLLTRDVHYLSLPSDATLLGVDGIYLAGRNVLIATQNGTNPQRVIRILLNPAGLAIDRVDTLTSRQADDITLGTIANGAFYFNGQAGWDDYADDGKPRDESKLKPSVVYRVPLVW